MEKFTYKVTLFTHEVEVCKEMISYKGKTIPGNLITGIGFSFVKVGQVIAGQLLGGVVGAAISQKGFSAGGLDKDITNLPDAFGQMIITYSEDGKSQKVLRIPVSSGDENCKRMLTTVASIFQDRFVGFGGQAFVEKELKISQKVAYIIVAVIIITIVVIAIVMGSLQDSGSVSI